MAPKSRTSSAARVDRLLEDLEVRLGWPITLPPATLEIRLLRDGSVRLYGRLERQLKKSE